MERAITKKTKAERNTFRRLGGSAASLEMISISSSHNFPLLICLFCFGISCCGCFIMLSRYGEPVNFWVVIPCVTKLFVSSDGSKLTTVLLLQYWPIPGFHPLADFWYLWLGVFLIPRRGSPKPTKRREGEKEGEKEGKEEGERGKKKRRGIQLIILLAISVLCSSIYYIQCWRLFSW